MAVRTDLNVDRTDKLVEINSLCKMAADHATSKDSSNQNWPQNQS